MLRAPTCELDPDYYWTLSKKIKRAFQEQGHVGGTLASEVGDAVLYLDDVHEGRMRQLLACTLLTRAEYALVSDFFFNEVADLDAFMEKINLAIEQKTARPMVQALVRSAIRVENNYFLTENDWCVLEREPIDPSSKDKRVAFLYTYLARPC